MDWKPIATAPMDGSTIVLGGLNEVDDWCVELVKAGEFEFTGDGWGMSRGICPYTHWYPIAPPPEPN